MIAASPQPGSMTPVPTSSVALGGVTLRGRRQAARRRRLVMRLRDWLGVTVIACFSLTLFAVTFLSLLGH